MTTLDPRLSVEQGEFAVYRGDVYKSVGFSRGTRRLLFDDEAAFEAFPDQDAVERTALSDGRHWKVHVLDSALDRVYYREVIARWFGEQVRVTAVPDVATGTVAITYERHPLFAAAMHMGGDQYSGWHTRVDATELEDIEVVEEPVPLRDDP